MLRVFQQRQGISTGLASSVSSSRTATLTRSRKATQTCAVLAPTRRQLLLCRLLSVQQGVRSSGVRSAGGSCIRSFVHQGVRSPGCAALCFMVLLCVSWCCSVFHGAALCFMVLLCVSWCCSVLHGAALCFMGPALPRSTGEVWQTLTNIGKSSRILNHQIISGPVNGQTS